MCEVFGSWVRVPPDVLKAVGIHDVCKGRCPLHATHGVNIESVRRVDCIEGVKNAVEVTNNQGTSKCALARCLFEPHCVFCAVFCNPCVHSTLFFEYLCTFLFSLTHRKRRKSCPPLGIRIIPRFRSSPLLICCRHFVTAV